MSEHVIDFCYWIDESNLNQTQLQQKMSAMFIAEIGNKTNGFERSEWSSSNNGEMERVLELKGMIRIYEVIWKNLLFTLQQG